MTRRKDGQTAQVMELFFAIAESLGLGGDRELANLVGVSPETVNNWRTGAVRELKAGKLGSVKQAMAAQIGALRERAGLHGATAADDLTNLDIAIDASPDALQRQLRERVHYDYLGHRFLYFEAQGALAWENLIREGYEQHHWLSGVDRCAESWLDARRGADGAPKGPIASAIGLGRRQRVRGLDVVSLGPGEGGKEAILADRLRKLNGSSHSLPWLSFALIDVSIPLLLRAARELRRRLAGEAIHQSTVYAVCADFEEGDLAFQARLPTESHEPDAGRRLVLILGNVFGNVRNEERFVAQKLSALTRPGDLVWLEVGLRSERVEQDPVYQLTERHGTETAAETNRRLLLQGPYRRWEAALGRQPADLELRVWVREDDESSQIRGSYNFCHDLVLANSRRTLTMLYSRRYDLEHLCPWLENRGYTVERVERVQDSKKVNRVAHVLLRRQ